MPPDFNWYFGIMAGFCLIHTTALLVVGIGLLRARSPAVRWFISLMIVQTCYFFIIGASWLIPGVGTGIAGASGVGNGGLALQFITLFPLWESLLGLWARNKTERETPLSHPGLS